MAAFLNRVVSRLLILAVAGLYVCLDITSASAVILYENDFEDDPVGTYTVSDLSADWNGATSNDGVDEGRVSITDDSNAVGNKSLVVMYPEGESNNGKSQWRAPLGGSYDELYLSYKIRFDDNFDFVRGGKLPGLCGGECNSGGDPPDGTDGWSARMMWRTNGSSGSPTTGDTSNIVQYVYYPDQPGTFAEDMRWDDTTPTEWQEFDSDVWYQLQHRIVMNTPGSSDGIIQAWLDDELVLDRQDVRFRTTSALKIDTLYFSTFFGGSSAVWEATKDEHVYYDDFIVSTEFINTSPTPGDFNDDGNVDGLDFLAWQQDPAAGDLADWETHYGFSSLAAAGGVIPEPSSVTLITCVFAFGMLSRRKLSC